MVESAGKDILIVEDETLLALDLKLSLREMGHSVVGSVITGEEALASIERQMPDLVMIDIKLDGDMDGIETSERIRQRHDIPVVFMTGNTDRDTLRRLGEFAPAGIVIKPLTDEKLRDVLDRAFS